jgi:uncharacterized oxidoreductase
VPAVPAHVLKALVVRVLAAAGAPEEAAGAVAESLVASNLKGVDSHGVLRVPEYLGAISEGRIVPAATPTVEARDGIAIVDGRWGFGQIAAREAAHAAAETAAARGLAAATLARVHHVGRLGEYVEAIAAAGAVGIAFCNTGPPGGRVVPHGGARPVLGTNPIAYAVPRAGRPPLVADFSTSAAAEGRLRLARLSRTPVPEGWIVDARGRPTTDPEDFYAGGALLPAGGHKGYALGLLVEILGGILAGAGTSSTGENPGNGLVLLALDPGAWGDRRAFLEAVERVAGAVTGVAPAGVDRVRLPGEPEAETEALRRQEGIPVPESTWRELEEAAAAAGVDLDAGLPRI